MAYGTCSSGCLRYYLANTGSRWSSANCCSVTNFPHPILIEGAFCALAYTALAVDAACYWRNITTLFQVFRTIAGKDGRIVASFRIVALDPAVNEMGSASIMQGILHVREE